MLSSSFRAVDSVSVGVVVCFKLQRQHNNTHSLFLVMPVVVIWSVQTSSECFAQEFG
jgi:hypothetical protein